MFRKIVLSICFFFTLNAFAQEGSSSPYSFYGLGEMRFKGTVDNRAMGGLSVISDSIHINLQNPAFYSELKFTTLTLGVSYLTTKLKTSSEEANARRSTLDYLAVAFPIGKFGASFGLMPVTSVGYKIRTASANTAVADKEYTGTGGINRLYAGASYKVTKQLSFGAEFGYHFGNIETTSTYQIPDVQFGSQELNESSASGPGMTVGLAYKTKFGTNKEFFASSAFSPAATLSFSNDRKVSTIQFLNNGSIRIIDQTEVPVADTNVKIPAKFSFGGGLGETKKWMVGAEMTFFHNKDLRNRFADISDVAFENAMRFSVGGFFIPNHASFSNYMKRMTYRAGFRYESTGLVINNESINDTGLTLGIGLPLGGTFSNINIGFEYGKRGTTKAGLIEENYANFTLALSLNDRWFVKRKFD